MPRRLGELAEYVGGRVVGDPARPLAGVRGLESAGPRDLSLLANPKFLERARASQAGALLTGQEYPDLERDLLIAGDPYVAFARILALFHPEVRPEPGIHPTAVVGEGCRIHASAYLGPYVVVGEGCEIGEGTVLHPHVVVGARCRIGAGAVLHPHAVLYPGTELGERTVIHAGSVLGADGFGYASSGGVHHKIPQVGRVVVEEDVEIGALTAIDRAALEATRIGAGTKIDNLVQVGHNVEIGRGSILCGQAGVAGSSRLGDGVVLGGQVGVVDHLEIGNGVQVAGKSMVAESVAPGQKLAGAPAIPLPAWRRQQALLKRLGEMLRRLRRLERQAGATEGSMGEDEGGE